LTLDRHVTGSNISGSQSENTAGLQSGALLMVLDAMKILLRKHKKYIIGTLLIVCTLGVLGYTGFSEGATRYYSVEEILDQGNTLLGKTIGVQGEVIEGITTEDTGLTILFSVKEITDNGSASDAILPVVYHGTVPDTFQAGRHVTIVGEYTGNGTFEAREIVTKCASKYEPVE